jgi:drug/metabolite transporter superfamily protein YnfA
VGVVTTLVVSAAPPATKVATTTQANMLDRPLRAERVAFIVLGCLTLAGYGLVVNLVKWDFAKLLGVYVAVFALVSVCWGRFVFREEVVPFTWAGLLLW